jgi:hypothetical protein
MPLAYSSQSPQHVQHFPHLPALIRNQTRPIPFSCTPTIFVGPYRILSQSLTIPRSSLLNASQAPAGHSSAPTGPNRRHTGSVADIILGVAAEVVVEVVDTGIRGLAVKVAATTTAVAWWRCASVRRAWAFTAADAFSERGSCSPVTSEASHHCSSNASIMLTDRDADGREMDGNRA